MSNRRAIAPPVKPSHFFVLTFALSWLIWIPLVLSQHAVIFEWIVALLLMPVLRTQRFDVEAG
jgi:hypothetical protein